MAFLPLIRAALAATAFAALASNAAILHTAAAPAAPRVNEAQYEKLIESLFGRELQCMLVPTIDDALAGVEFIKSEELGRGAFLVVGLHGGEDEEGGRGPVEWQRSRGREDEWSLSRRHRTLAG